MLRRSAQKGFTLIEVMIAMAIFTVIVTIGIGAILDATSQHQRSKNMRSVMDNLNFVMEDMARNIRLGSEVRCVTSANDITYPGYIDNTGAIVAASCGGGSNKLIFRSLTGTPITYTISVPTTNTPSRIFKQVGDSSSAGVAKEISPEEVVIDFTRSGFTVTGAEPSDFQQPIVTIRLAGTVTYKDQVSTFSIQTSVVLRQLDS
jgi:prepilin-type N-terminal cleavage/methylation domain-containing protein